MGEELTNDQRLLTMFHFPTNLFLKCWMFFSFFSNPEPPNYYYYYFC